MITTTPAPAPDDSKAKAAEARRAVLECIAEAQNLLYEAAQYACPLQGWCKQWTLIGDHADATKALWHKINNAPRPAGHD